MPTLDGKRFVRASDFSGPVLVNFWGRDCPPCVAELPRLGAFARANPDWTVLLVATDAPLDAQRFLDKHGVDLPALRGGNAVPTLMRRAGETRAGLPFSVAVRRGVQCDVHRGELLDEDLMRMRARCEATR